MTKVDLDDLMSKSNSPSVDRYINREMGILMNRGMPVALATAKELIKSGEAKDEAAFIREYLTDMKSSLNAMVKEGEEDIYQIPIEKSKEILLNEKK